MDGTPALPTSAPDSAPNIVRIRDAAMACYAADGVAATSLRTVAEAAEVSLGLVQHYFPTKAALTAAVDAAVLTVMDHISAITTKQPPTADDLGELGRRVASALDRHRVAADYIARALIEDSSIGRAVFDDLLQMSARQQELFAAHGLARPDLDPVWAALHPLVLRLSAMVLHSHIERHLPAPLYSPAELQRWDTGLSSLMQRGQTPRLGPAEGAGDG